jgi:hypothetical protein
MQNKTYNKRFNAQRAAKSALGADAEFETYKAENGEWAWREIKVATKATAGKLGKRAAAIAAAQSGNMPARIELKPAEERYKRIAEPLQALADAGDIAGLEAFHIKTYSSTPKRLAKWRDLAVMALKARR